MQAIAAEPRIYGTGTSEAEWQAWSGLADIRPITVAQLANARRVVIVAPHPDDEVLGCGGLMALLSEQVCEVLLVAVTDGEASHPGSSLWPAAKLRRSRAAETAAALAVLSAGGMQVIRAGFGDGKLQNAYGVLVKLLMCYVNPGDVVIGTWSEDGHPDHDAVGRACAAVAATRRAVLLEVPIWTWHWGSPGDSRIPWRRAVKIMLPAEVVEKKRRAIACFQSQLQEDRSTGHPPILPPHVLARFYRPYELFFMDK